MKTDEAKTSEMIEAHSLKIIVPFMASALASAQKRRTPTLLVKRFDDLPKDAPTYLVLGVPFGGPYNGKDAQGEYFFDGTDIRANIGDEIPLTFDHGHDPDNPFLYQDPPEFIGAARLLGVASLDPKHTGHWYIARLDPEAKLSKLVSEAKTSSLAVSSGSIHYLTRMTRDGQIYVFPIGELAIFPVNHLHQPANPYAIALDFGTPEAEKVIAQLSDDAKAIIAKAFEGIEGTDEANGETEAEMLTAQPAKAVGNVEGEAEGETEVNPGANPNADPNAEAEPENQKTKEITEVYAMENYDELLKLLDAKLDEKLSALQRNAGVDPIVDALVARFEEKGVFSQAGKSLAPDQTGGAQEAHDHKSVVDAFNAWAMTGRGASLTSTARKDLTETGDGQALVPVEYANEIIKKIGERSIFTRYGLYSKRVVRSRLSEWPRMSYSNRAAVFSAPEEVAKHNITSDKVTATLANIGYLTLVEQPLVVDNPRVWPDVVLPDAANAFAGAENYYLTIGSGSGEPQGIVTATTQTRDLANADHIEADDLLALLYKTLPSDYITNAVWLMHPSTAYEVARMKDTTGRYLWQPSLQAGMPPQLLGRPVYLDSYMPTLADGAGAKVVVLYDPAYYYYFSHPSILAMRLNEHYITSGFIGYLTVVRYDARLMNDDAAAALTVPTV